MRIFYKPLSAFALGLTLSGLSLQSTHAKPLTKAEQTVCQSLRHCMDIVERHDASEYDYEVLEAEFKRFGPTGRNALFHLLTSSKAHSDVARLLAEMGPLTAVEAARVDQIWSGPNATLVLPLFQEMTLANRDRWIAGLTHSKASVRAFSRRLYDMDVSLMRAPLTAQQTAMILSDMIETGNGSSGDYLSHLSAAGHEAAFEKLLYSGANVNVVSSAYDGLYKQNPAKAFQSLMAAMRAAQTAQQISNLGEMIARRHRQRADGFYAKFAVDFSNDTTAPANARAVALQAWFAVMRDGDKTTSKRPVLPVMNTRRLEAFQFLLKTEEANLKLYASVLDRINNPSVQPAIDMLWAHSERENHQAQPAILKAALDTSLEPAAIQSALRSNDSALMIAALRAAQTRAEFSAPMRALQQHPIVDVRVAARLASQGKLVTLHNKAFYDMRQVALRSAPRCEITGFDIQDLVLQMPYFDDAPVNTKDHWVKSVTRAKLNAAHPTSKGWLASYYLGAQGGALVYFDGQSAEGRRVGNFQSPFAILPDRPLKLGESTDRFWIVDTPGHLGMRQGLYQVKDNGNGFDVRRVTELPAAPIEADILQNGDVVIAFDDSGKNLAQPPLRFSPDGRISSACGMTPLGANDRP